LRELVSFTQIHRLVSPLYVAVTNAGDTTAYDVRIELRLPGRDRAIIVIDGYGYPRVPVRKHGAFDFPSRRAQEVGERHDVWVEEVGDSWVVEALTEKVQPKGTHWFQDPFFVGSYASQEIAAEVVVFADNLSQPHHQTLTIRFASTSRTVDLEEIMKLEIERFRSSPEHQQFLRGQGLDKPDATEP